METLAWFLVWGMAPALSRFVEESFLPKKNKTTTTTTMALSSNSSKEKEQASKKRLVHGELVALEANITDETIACMEELCRPGCEHGWFPSCYHSTKLHYRKWVPLSSTNVVAPKAVVIFMHGINTHSGKVVVVPKTGQKLSIAVLADTLVRQHNVALYAFDLYGHGLSEGMRHWIPASWTTNRDDYIAFCRLVATEHPDVPILYVCFVFVRLFSFPLPCLALDCPRVVSLVTREYADLTSHCHSMR
jgi:Serine aminopeptidase, S33